MFLRSITIKGVTRLYFYESYYENGRTKQKCIESLGRLDELQKRFDDPVSSTTLRPFSVSWYFPASSIPAPKGILSLTNRLILRTWTGFP